MTARGSHLRVSLFFRRPISSFLSSSPVPPQAVALGQIFSYKHPNPLLVKVKDYANENKAQTTMSHNSNRSSRKRSRRRMTTNRYPWLRHHQTEEHWLRRKMKMTWRRTIRSLPHISLLL
ncbi:hypothetical protein ACFX1Q_046138 [Malus domestica]